MESLESRRGVCGWEEREVSLLYSPHTAGHGLLSEVQEWYVDESLGVTEELGGAQQS